MDIQSKADIEQQPVKHAVERPNALAVIQHMLQEIAYLQSNAGSEIQGLVFNVRAQLEYCLKTTQKTK